MNELASELWPFIELVIPEGGRPTLMPRWKELEDSFLPVVLAQDSLAIDREDIPEVVPPARVLVVIHAYDLEYLADLLKRFKTVHLLGDLVITTDTQHKALLVEDLHRRILGPASRLQVELMPNLGRDVLPFWGVLEKYGKGYDYFLKLHLKRSSHWEELGYWNASVEAKDAGPAWNDDCFDTLIPSSDAECRSLLRWMADHRLGASFPRPHRIVARFGWGSEQNMVITTQILADLGCDPMSLLRPLFFPAGNMFWGAMDSFLPLVPYFMEGDRYPLEPIPLDGTFLHAVERCYSYLLGSAGVDVGFLFPPRIVSPSSGLRALKASELVSGTANDSGQGHSTDVLRLHGLYTSATRQWRDQAHTGERRLKALEAVIRSIERNPLRRIKARLQRLLGDY